METLQVNKVRTKEELESSMAIRKRVFVEEQGIDPQLERENEEGAVYFLATMDNQPCAACRYRKTQKGYKLERFAVLKEFRGKRLGQALLAAVLGDIPDDGQQIYLHALKEAVGLYTRFGFAIEGDQFQEAGIPHYRMVK